MDWDPDFVERSPMLEPLRPSATRLREYSRWPERADLQRLLEAQPIVTRGGARLSLVEPANTGAPYESRIYLEGGMQYREGEWHDFFNLLAWIAYPRTKAALNEAHHFESLHAGTAGDGSNRSRVRDALTVFDESGAIAASSDADLLRDIECFRWKPLFWERRERVVAGMRVHLFGHALFEKALDPYVGMTAHALLLPLPNALIAAPEARRVESIDELAAARVPGMRSPQELSPLPLLGVPGWWPDNEAAAFYDDENYFRSGRSPRPPRGLRPRSSPGPARS
jgi:hypothetical protein